MEFLTIEGLTLQFGGLLALKDVSMYLKEGEIHGLIGPNGAGKTSLVNTISGIYRPNRGRILFRGRDLVNLAPHEIAALGVGRTFQNVETFADQTVMTNVVTGLYLHLKHGFWSSILRLGRARRGEGQAQEEAERLLEVFNLSAYRDVPAGDLPFGIQKRLEQARALAAQPNLLLLDEPTSGMSELETEETIETLKSVRSEREVTLLVIEHNMRAIMTLADRLTVLNYGEKIAEGTPEEVQQNPMVITAYLGEQENNV